LKTKHKIIIDAVFGTPLVYIINVAARFLGFILRIDHSLDKQFKTIVISKYVGLGSIIQATPLIQTLRKKFPDANIIFATVNGNKVLLDHIPEINEVITISDKNFFSVIGSSIKLLLKLWRIKPQLFIDLEFHSNYSSIITTLSKSRNRLGFYKPDKTYRKGIYNYLVPFNVDTSISLSYLQFSHLVKCDKIITGLKIEVNNDNWAGIQKKINLNKSRQYIVVNPNASDLRLERRWPQEAYINVINSFLEKNDHYILVLVGDKKEVEYVRAIESKLNKKENLINSAGKLSLTELIELIANASLMLTNDTGPMHIAFATKTKTISLFGPCSPMQYGGLENGITFYKKVHCSPCVHTHLLPPCYGDNQCMKKITENEVSGAIDTLLSFQTSSI